MADPPASPAAIGRSLWLPAIAAWLALALVMGVQLDLGELFGGTSVDVERGFLWVLGLLALWLPSGLLVVWLARLVPIRRDRWFLPGLAHLAFAAALAVAHGAAGVVLARWLVPFPAVPSPTLRGGLYYFLATNAHLELVIYWAVLGACLALGAHREIVARDRRAAQLEARLGDARLAALQAQIRPHFFFNALNTVSMLIRNDEPARATHIISEIGDLIRRSLSGELPHRSPLADEVGVVRHYLEIETVRFEDRLQVDFDIPAELGNALVPTFALHTLVENAVRHGSAGTSGRFFVHLRARQVDSNLELTVRNGLGDAAATAAQQTATAASPAPEGLGLGLANIRSRLTQLYGEAAGLTLESASAGSTVARLTVPLEAAREAAALADGQEPA